MISRGKSGAISTVDEKAWEPQWLTLDGDNLTSHVF